MRATIIRILAALLLSIDAQALVFSVTHTEDTVDADPGDGFCADDMDRCTLRAAVMEANANATDDIIDLPMGTYVLEIVGLGDHHETGSVLVEPVHNAGARQLPKPRGVV